MRTNSRIFTGALLLVVAGAFLIDARAGNLPSVATTQYYDITLGPNQYFAYTGSASDVTIVVDDVTFHCFPAPDCPSVSNCSFLDVGDPQYPGAGGDLGTWLNFDLSSPAVSITVPGFPGTTSALGSTTTTSSSTWLGSSQVMTAARTWDYAITLLDEYPPNSGTGSQTIDMHGFYGYAATAMRETQVEKSFKEIYAAWRPADEDPNAIPGYPAMNGGARSIGGAGGMGMGVGTGVGLTSLLVRTTDSRHYQSPHIVQRGRVALRTQLGKPPGASTAIVKGRVFIGTTGAPIANTDLTVGNL